MDRNPVVNAVEEQDWLRSLGDKSDTFVNTALDSVGDAKDATRDALVNSRLLGHMRHPTITDVPFGSWTVTLVADGLDIAGHKQYSAAADISLAVGLVSSLLASAGGLADLSETQGQTDRRLGTMHGVLQGVTMLLFGGSLAARRTDKRGIGRILSLAGYATSIASSYLANELVESRRSAV